MDNLEYRQWKPPVDTALPDLHGCFDDLLSAKDFAERLVTELNAHAPDPVLIDALATAVLIRYCRCFTTGVRSRLTPEDCPLLSEDDKRLHDRLRAIRNWHVAHPVNLQEVQVLYVGFDPDPNATTGVLGIQATSTTHLPINSHESEAVAKLCETWLEWLRQRVSEEQLRIRPHAESLTRQELLSLPSSTAEPNPDLSARRRQRPKSAA